MGDVHGHLQLGLGVAARWQDEIGSPFEAVLICGDVAAFGSVERVDRATRRFAKRNPCELEFPSQWMRPGRSPWLEGIWDPKEKGGLGLTAPVIMTYGNHEDFDLMAAATPAGIPGEPVEIGDLTAVDPAGRILLLPSGWKVRLPGGAIVGAVGGIQPGQRTKAGYPPMAYAGEDAVAAIADAKRIDCLITHQGPAMAHGPSQGSTLLDRMLEAGNVRTWFHGHSIKEPGIRDFGGCTVVPLHGIPFKQDGRSSGQAGDDSWCAAHFDEGAVNLDRRRPECWWEFHQRNWTVLPGGQMVAPPLAHLVPKFGSLEIPD